MFVVIYAKLLIFFHDKKKEANDASHINRLRKNYSPLQREGGIKSNIISLLENVSSTQ